MRRVVVWMVLGGMVSGSGWGQVQKLEDPSAFAPEAVLLDFSKEAGLSPSVGTLAGGIFAEWGIEFGADAGSVPLIEWAVVPGSNIGTFGSPAMETFKVVSNRASGDSSAGMSLIVDFSYPVRRVAFGLGNGGPGTTGEIGAYDASGQALGSVEGAVEPFDLDGGGFLGIEAVPAAGISKVTIDYGDAESAEQVSFVLMEYVSRPLFRLSLAQVGKGNLPGGGILKTTITIVNLANSTARGEVRFVDGGSASAVSGPGQTMETVDFLAGAFRSESFSTDDLEENFFAGYAMVESSTPLAATATYEAIAANGKTLSQAGVGAQPARTFLVGPAVNRRPSILIGSGPILDPLETGIAIANLSDSMAQVEIRLLDSRPPESAAPERLLQAWVSLHPSAHIARFVSQLFEEIKDEDFRGSFVLTSTQPVAVTTLHTIGGLPRASLPVGSTQR